MRGACFKVALGFWAAALTGGCTPTVGKLPPVTLDTSGTAAGVHYGDLGAVLKGAVAAGGRVKPRRLPAFAARLDAQLRRLAVTGPTVTPRLFSTEGGRLAYWYNARAAWALKLLVLYSEAFAAAEEAAGVLTRGVDRLARRQLKSRGIDAEDFQTTQFPLDGRTMTLEGIDALLADRFGWRVLAAAPGVAPDRAALPAGPFSANDAAGSVAQRFERFIDDDSRLTIDVPSRHIRVPPVLWRFREQLIALHNETYNTRGATLTTALLRYVRGSAHRRLQDAVGYRCVRAARARIPPLEKRKR